MDPPYNTESAKTDGNTVADNNENISANKFIYRDKFSRNGWLNMMNERLQLAHQLLKEDGVIFVSIDDNEQAYLKVLMDDIFGEENFLTTIVFDKTSQGTTLGNYFKKTHEFVEAYAKNISKFELNKEKMQNSNKYNYIDEFGGYALSNKLNSINSYLEDNRNRGYTIYYNKELNDVKVKFEYDTNTLVYSQEYDEELTKKGYVPIRPGKRKNKNTVWNWSYERFLKDWKTEIEFKKDSNGILFPYIKNREKFTRDPITIQKFDTRKTGNGVLNSIFGEVNFNYAKPYDLIMWIIDRHPNINARILDFFAGSGTTGHAILELNRQDGGNRTFTLVTNNENNIGKKIAYERLYRINHGFGSEKENFDWTENNESYNNHLDVYRTSYSNVDIFSDSNDNKSIKESLLKELNDFGIKTNDEKYKDDDLLRKLTALKPQTK
ncbi:site-specific DNA-methyltransferase [Metamycoplasma cloacale]|uniref:site-specific DNA-methyltransferase n=1 Tax=Metamycoplasma cloacale TaxID=92401 RepID=UPI00237C3B3D|nr:site-specific DNA-methyltransferase [Metamycoplasma cloacale]